MSVRRLLLFVSLVLTGTLLLAACGGDDDSEATPAEAATEEASPEPAPTEPGADLCESLDNLEAVLSQYGDLDPDANTLDDVSAINEQVEDAFNDVVSAAQELDLSSLESLKDDVVSVVEEERALSEETDTTRSTVIGTAAKSAPVTFEIEDLKSENC